MRLADNVYKGRVDLAEVIDAYEYGSLCEEDCIALFQVLVDTGLAWTLQGHYGRTAKALLDEGIITPRSREEGV